MVDVQLSSSYIVGFDVFDHQLDRGVAVVGILLHRVADVERLHTLDMVVVPVHAESDGVHGVLEFPSINSHDEMPSSLPTSFHVYRSPLRQASRIQASGCPARTGSSSLGRSRTSG